MFDEYCFTDLIEEGDEKSFEILLEQEGVTFDDSFNDVLGLCKYVYVQSMEEEAFIDTEEYVELDLFFPNDIIRRILVKLLLRDNQKYVQLHFELNCLLKYRHLFSNSHFLNSYFNFLII